MVTRRKMGYEINSRDYLRRAKECLDRGDNRFLFYAAFEIRCGVEARMSEYLEVQEHVSKKKKQGWRVAVLAKNIEQAFRTGEKVAILKVVNEETGKLEVDVRYTPVRASLRKRVEKLGNYLHSAKKYYGLDSGYWKKFRQELDDAVIELEWATSGRLLGPILMRRNSSEVKVMIELPTEKEKAVIENYLNLPGVTLIVDYE
jgi:hypothetical protein